MFRFMTAGLLILTWALPVLADQTIIQNYDQARRIFWADVYPDKPTGRPHSDIYCGFDFRTRDDVEMQVEHVYPANWIGTALQCGSRTNCQETSERFNLIEADLHNLWPSEKNANQLRSNHSFAVINGETWDFEDCDMEKAAAPDDTTPTNWIIEPRNISRGNIARSIFYMAEEYDLPIEERLIPLLKQWNKSDRVSADEKRRNDLIAKVQGTRNHYIDDPKLVDSEW